MCTTPSVQLSVLQVDREYRVMRALQGTEVPVPTMYTYCDDTAVLGQEWYLMSYIPVQHFFRNASHSAASHIAASHIAASPTSHMSSYDLTMTQHRLHQS